MVGLADGVCAAAGIARSEVTQTVIGSPGVYDPRRGSIALPGGIAGWGKPEVVGALHEAFGSRLVVENDVDAATLAEQEYGHGREADTFVFVSIGTGIGMGLVIGGSLHRGAHGLAGEIAFMPISAEQGTDPGDARRRGQLEASASAPAVVRAGRRAGMRGTVTARRVFAAAAAGDPAAAAIVAEEARLVAKAVCAIVTVVDPEKVVLGGGIGQAPGFAAAVASELTRLTPVVPDVMVSALGVEAVVDGCIAAGAELAWQQLTALVP
jgi:predicted NBD/HSP70 family sugar kinase